MQSTHNSRGEQRRRRRRVRRGARALAALALLVLAAAGTAMLGTGAAAADSGITLKVNECDPAADPAPPDPSTCSDRSLQIAPTPAPPASDGSGTATPPPREVHRYSLRSGKGTVQTDAGSQPDSIQLPAGGADALAKPVQPDPSASPPVSTVGGGLPPAGGGSTAFDFVSGDQALAQFEVPPFLIPIYTAAGRAYGIPWNVLASINKIETDFGRNLNVSSAGAEGWMQFMPGTWRSWGVDATGDGIADPYNPVDAIYAAARYLQVSGGATDLRKAILSYNHAGWYADRVLSTANIYGSLPAGLVAETGSLAYGRFPVKGPVRYGDDFRAAEKSGRRADGLTITARSGATAIVTQAVTVRQVLLDATLARELRTRHSLADRGLARGAVSAPPTPKPSAPSPKAVAALDAVDAFARAVAAPRLVGSASVFARAALVVAAAHPGDPVARGEDGLPRGYGAGRLHGITVVVADGAGNRYTYGGLDRVAKGVRPGASLHGGAALGTLPRSERPKLVFATRAAGGAAVDPRPLVDGYRLQETANFYHAVAPLGRNPFLPDAAVAAGGAIRGTDRELAARVLADDQIHIYPCGRQDIEHGIVDRRVLGALLYLRRAGLELTITSLRCGHGFYTAGGNVSAHSFGAAVDIAAFNGQPVTGHQGPGSLTEQAIRLLMKLDGPARPSQLISLMNLGGPSFALADHYDHLHVGYAFDRSLGLGRTGDAAGSVQFGGGAGAGALAGGGAAPGDASRGSEQRLSSRLGRIRNPHVRSGRGPGAIDVDFERRADAPAASRTAATAVPVRALSDDAPARLVDVDVPAGGAAGEAYALGELADTPATPGHARQVVLLRRAGTSWRVVGPPRDARGRVVAPRLRALATLPGGSGYAVGDHGAVVLLDGARAPRLVDAPTRANLRAVAVRSAHGRLTGYAAGDRGSVLRLDAARAERRSASRRLSLTTVAFGASGAPLVAGKGPASAGTVVSQLRGGSWQALGAGARLPQGARVSVNGMAARDGTLWVVGGLVPAPAGATAAPAAGGSEVAFAARRDATGWTTFCTPYPALAAVAELGKRTPVTGCDKPFDAGVPGAATDVALISGSAAVATPGGLGVLRPDGWIAVPAAGGPAAAAGVAVTRLAVDPAGGGWATGPGQRVDRLVAAADAGAPATPVDDAGPAVGGADAVRPPGWLADAMDGSPQQGSVLP